MTSSVPDRSGGHHPPPHTVPRSLNDVPAVPSSAMAAFPAPAKGTTGPSRGTKVPRETAGQARMHTSSVPFPPHCRRGTVTCGDETGTFADTARPWEAVK
ncbi:hypothetical protein Sdia_03790 [Streptomyces diastaticus subsp. diastaticus]|uniref:Uncharacterized protein n=1 Tax=Streptomyces diastaticus subsp. diastaticus TaxID=68040 RepID=A0ABQ1CHW3_STRDI|nr:hypothetical protein Sdia_03790 [Streptomyces diastaticus subsp. diastaticus]GGU18361.1 hypothetical protein GCM10015534_21380 [Streptomyces diastaticus subsp. diastaticus]